MKWLAENWLWVLIGILFVSMHMFGHGGHGGRSGCGHKGNNPKGKPGSDPDGSDKPSGHRH